MNKKVLIITYYWPPSGGAGVQRWLKFAKYLPEFGWIPHIYTPENPEAPVLDESLIKDVTPKAVVIKKKIFEPYSFYKKFTGKKGNVAHGFLSEDKDSRQKFTEKLSVFIRGNFFIPDARKFWIRPSVRFLKKYILENDIKTVITTGPPHSMHLIGLGLKKSMNINWIADFRDPWTNIDFYKDLKLTQWADKKHHKLELSVLQKADFVISIGKTMQEEFEKMSGRKIKLITNGFDEDDFEIQKSPDNNFFYLSHIGSINFDRNHEIFWKGIKELREENEEFKRLFKLKLVGKNDYSVIEKIQEYNLSEAIEFTPYLPHNEIAEQMQLAHVLYLPLNNTPNTKGVLTGKFFEYMAANRPILCIGHPEGDVADIMKKTNCGNVIDFTDLSSFKNQLLEFFIHYQNNSLGLESSFKKYSRRNLTAELVKIIESVTL